LILSFQKNIFNEINEKMFELMKNFLSYLENENNEFKVQIPSFQQTNQNYQNDFEQLFADNNNF
jgi:hypothetical protein